MSAPKPALAVLDDQHNELLSAGSFSGEGCWFRNGQEEEVVADYAKARTAIEELMEIADEAYAELLADSRRDGPRCLLLTRLETALRAVGGANVSKP